jgi:hypothetical protein
MEAPAPTRFKALEDRVQQQASDRGDDVSELLVIDQPPLVVLGGRWNVLTR